MGPETRGTILEFPVSECPRGYAYSLQETGADSRCFLTTLSQGERQSRLLAWLEVENSCIANIKAEYGTLLSEPDQMNAKFKQYYTHLYASRATYSLEDLTSFLDTIEFPTLTAEAVQTLR